MATLSSSCLTMTIINMDFWQLRATQHHCATSLFAALVYSLKAEQLECQTGPNMQPSIAGETGPAHDLLVSCGYSGTCVEWKCFYVKDKKSHESRLVPERVKVFHIWHRLKLADYRDTSGYCVH